MNALNDISGEFPYAHCKYHAKSINDHEKRLRKMEKMIWMFVGASAIAAFGGGFLAKLIGG